MGCQTASYTARHTEAWAALPLLFSLAVGAVLSASTSAGKAVLAPVPAGSTLPATLERSLDATHVYVGATVVARLAQRVPLADGGYLSSSAEVVGSITAVSPTALSLLFTTVRWHGATEPVRVKLLAAASWLDVIETHTPLGSAAHSTSDWTTVQIGGDEVYGVNVATKVYDRYSQPVGRADGTGVYAMPLAPDGPERAMGPFSTTAAGIYDLDGFSIGPVSNGGPVVFKLADPHWKLHAGTGLLFEVVAP